MKIKNIEYTPEFIKNWRKIPKTIQNKAIVKEKLFREDYFHKSLKTHKLKGKMDGFWSFSIDYHWRIVFLLKEDQAVFITIGTHGIYK